MKRLLVTGAGGMVGSYAPEVFKGLDLALTDIVDDYQRLDVRDAAAVRAAVAAFRPDLVLHLAAATDVDRCQQDPDWAYHSNAVGTQNVALACQVADVPLVYVSTAGVFGGDKPEPYIEFDAPSPVNVYGVSKLAGEQVVTSLLSRWYIVRAGWMIGGGARDKKFVGKIAALVAAGRSPVRAVDDKLGSPTYAKDLLAGIRRLAETGDYGLYHMVNAGCGSRYEVACAVRDALGRPEVEVVPVSSAHFPLPAPRARSEAMRNLKLDLLGMPMRPWREALHEYVTRELAPRPS
ncbi:MAG: dTDP-4-dehydrorhamnose reductase [Candidatus Rokubacteria bacterium]|nr:dTDP-4-dehydrorhamnose reductase [Candidatus Rokubacteria bacterium]